MADADPDRAAALARYLGGITVTEDLTESYDEADALVTAWLAGFPTVTVPPIIVARAVREVAADLWNRRDAPNGIKQFGDGAGGVIPVRVARDPLTAAYPLLAPFTGPGVA